MVLRQGWAWFLVKVIWARSFPGWAVVSPPPPGWSPPSVASLGLCVATQRDHDDEEDEDTDDTSHARLKQHRARQGSGPRPMPR